MLTPLKLEPLYREYVWGGERLRPGINPTAEAWIVFEDNQISEGEYQGFSLADLTEQQSQDLLGSRPLEQTGTRFPLLIKLLDCEKWLSLQVHPNDEQAKRMLGSGHFGKTEAWYIVDAVEGAQLISGFRPGVTRKKIVDVLHSGEILDVIEKRNIQRGDSILITPGMIHALGPGSLVYEVQQTSDITYRVYDWGRPMTAGRKLHIDEAMIALDPGAAGDILSVSCHPSEGAIQLATSKYFTLELLKGSEVNVAVNTRGESFTSITVVDGNVRIEGQDWVFDLDRFETLLIPAVCSEYEVAFSSPARVLKAFVP
jgi:mannose-6-phosphate isomerase